MSEPHRWGDYLCARPSDRFLMARVLVLTVLTDLALAIGVGVGVGLALRMLGRNVPPADWQPPER